MYKIPLSQLRTVLWKNQVHLRQFKRTLKRWVLDDKARLSMLTEIDQWCHLDNSGEWCNMIIPSEW